MTIRYNVENPQTAINENTEILLKITWNDSEGRAMYTDYQKYETLEEAEKEYKRLKTGNGSYVTLKIEIRQKGTLDRMNTLEREIANLQVELDLLKGK